MSAKAQPTRLAPKFSRSMSLIATILFRGLHIANQTCMSRGVRPCMSRKLQQMSRRSVCHVCMYTLQPWPFVLPSTLEAIAARLRICHRGYRMCTDVTTRLSGFLESFQGYSRLHLHPCQPLPQGHTRQQSLGKPPEPCKNLSAEKTT